MADMENRGKRVVLPKEEPSGTPDVADDDTAVNDGGSEDDNGTVAAISVGQVDPVYEAKAMAINRAVRPKPPSRSDPS
jgi:hypothetical protein